MSMTDPISDMLTRIRNGQKARLSLVDIPYSKIKEKILVVLVQEGYIESCSQTEDKKSKFNCLQVKLKYLDGVPVIRKIDRVSKPGRRVYSSCDEISHYYGGLGSYVISTSKGILSDFDARKQRLGGEILCKLF